MKFQSKYFAAVLAAATLFVSCSNDDDSTQPIDGTTGDAELFFDNGVAGDALVLGTSYTNSNNETLTINRLNYIIGNIVLIKEDGSEFAYPKADSYFVISQEDGRQTIDLHDIPAGDYKKVRFGVGVDNARYLQGETAQQSFWDLATQYEMTWTWSTGYKFVLFEGTFTAAGLDGEKVFQVHQGSNTATDNYREVTLNLPTTARVRQGDVPSIHLKTNINVLLDGDTKIKLKDNLNPAGTTSAIMGGQNLIDIANNSLKMFEVDMCIMELAVNMTNRIVSFTGQTILLVMLSCVLLSCSEDSDYSVVDKRMNFVVPSNFPAAVQNVELNYPTEKGFELGRKLFYDGRLSADGTISCSFCHEQGYAFTHHGHDFSHGINDQIGIRNAPAIQNLAFLNEYFYDGASDNMEMLSIVPIHNPVEMAETMEGITAKLQKDAAYVKLYKQAFEDGQVSTGNTLKALGQFMTMMVSANSRYDKYVRNEPGGTMSDKELEGMQVFSQKCASCHSTDLFTDGTFRNNGLPPNPNLDDRGREVVTGFPADRYKFKVPSLRNAALTAPYMHDGRFGSLESVLNFYTTGVKESATLDPLLHQNGVLGLSLTQNEKEAVIAFIKTLTDDDFITNPLFYYKT